MDLHKENSQSHANRSKMPSRRARKTSSSREFVVTEVDPALGKPFESWHRDALSSQSRRHDAPRASQPPSPSHARTLRTRPVASVGPNSASQHSKHMRSSSALQASTTSGHSAINATATPRHDPVSLVPRYSSTTKSSSSSSSASLKQQLSEKELQVLELQSRTMQELSRLRGTIRKQDVQLVESDQQIRRLQTQLQEEQAKHATITASNHVSVNALRDRVQMMMDEVGTLKHQVQSSEQKRTRNLKEHAKELSAKEEVITKYHREVQMLKTKLQTMIVKTQGTSESEVHWRERASTLQSKLANLRFSSEIMESKVQACAQREHALKETLEVSRAERTRLQDQLASANSEIEHLRVKLAQSRERNDTIEQRLGQLESIVVKHNRNAQATSPRAVPKPVVRPAAADDQHVLALSNASNNQEAGSTTPLSAAEPSGDEDAGTAAEGDWDSATQDGEIRDVISNLKRQTSLLKEELQATQDKLQDKENAVVTLTNQAHSRQLQISSLNQTIRNMRSMLENVKQKQSDQEQMGLEQDDLLFSEQEVKVAELQQHVDELSNALSHAEWAKVEAENKAESAQYRASDLNQQLATMKQDMDELVVEIHEMKDNLQVLSQEKTTSALTIRQLTDKVQRLSVCNELWTSQDEGIGCTPEQVVHALGKLYHAITQLLPRMEILCTVLRCKLDGEAPPMHLLLEEGANPLDEETTEAADSAGFPGIEHCDAVVENIRAQQHVIGDLKTELADLYAESVGNECYVQ